MIGFWEKRKAELDAGENLLKQRLHPDVGKVVGPKNVLLFKEMLEHIRYELNDITSNAISCELYIISIPIDTNQ